jgi:hypoxanthine-DNA glycosylase
VSLVQGFPPIAREDAHTLILGSMPSRESLARNRYYAHPRNAFWPIVTQLTGISEVRYEPRARALAAQGFAVWDVLQACFRSSSLDSDIDDSTIVTNDFGRFHEKHPGITRIFFNGAKAESVYTRHVLPGLVVAQAVISRHRLPSTSPAHAGMTREQKMQAWRVILR